MVKRAEGGREEQRQWRQEERKWRERMENRKEEWVQTSGNEGKGKEKEVEEEVGLRSDDKADSEGNKE